MIPISPFCESGSHSASRAGITTGSNVFMPPKNSEVIKATTITIWNNNLAGCFAPFLSRTLWFISECGNGTVALVVGRFSSLTFC